MGKARLFIRFRDKIINENINLDTDKKRKEYALHKQYHYRDQYYYHPKNEAFKTEMSSLDPENFLVIIFYSNCKLLI